MDNETVFGRLGVIFGNGYPPFEVIDVPEEDIEEIDDNKVYGVCDC